MLYSVLLLSLQSPTFDQKKQFHVFAGSVDIAGSQVLKYHKSCYAKFQLKFQNGILL